MLAKTQDNEQVIERVAACDIGKGELVCCVRVPDEDHRGRRLQEAGDLFHHDPAAAGYGRPAGLPGSDPGGDGGNAGLLEAGVLPAGGGGV